MALSPLKSPRVRLPLARGGKLRALAVTSNKRASVAPDIPIAADTLPGFELAGWYGVLAPGATPRGIVDKFGASIHRGMQAPEIKARVAADGSEAVGSLPGEFDRFLRSEMARFAKVIKNAGIKPGE